MPGYSGGCLAYVDDGVNPPKRQPTAQASWQYAVDTKVAHQGEEPPTGIWVPVYYSINNGPWAGYGHVAWFYSDGNNTVIYDSEFGCDNRTGPYSGGGDLFNYMGWQMSYLGWSEMVDGLRIVEKLENSSSSNNEQNKYQPQEEEEMIKFEVVEGGAKGTKGYLYQGRFIVGGSASSYNTIYQKLADMEKRGLIKPIKEPISSGEYNLICSKFPSHKNNK
ncbi:hypothetical protein MKK30_07905 [Lactococcus formosensis]|uniref:hypothetical protein n=1 Tax=Lactococcus formosensis TaxID=1281486 RepID=UPI001F061713|nr:hypothetical protein [Lactococcus formosensis]MCH1723560.1 hypothetical protein [Lactococcus formosensis]